MNIYPTQATYRLQFNKDFTFADLRHILPYLHRMGIKTIYASPVFAAVPGSTHGYDGVDPQTIDPAIGTLNELAALNMLLREYGMGWLQDIVPNHMAFNEANAWLMDALEKGGASPYYHFFDFLEPHERLKIPVLGDTATALLDEGTLYISMEQGKYFIQYPGGRLPLAAHSSAVLYNEVLQAPGACNGDERLPDLFAANQTLQAGAAKNLAALNADKVRLSEILAAQHYELCPWQEAGKCMNYRRFFTINQLIGLNIQVPEVFDAFHKTIKMLLDQDMFQGLRIDHIDGLTDPTAYLADLRKLTGESAYIVVEKILEQGEQLPPEWPVQGTTGYDFLAMVNNLFTYKQDAALFKTLYEQFEAEQTTFENMLAGKKRHILDQFMGGELAYIVRLFRSLPSLPATLDEDLIREGLSAFLVRCPVYRFYGSELPLQGPEATAIRNILQETQLQNPELTPFTMQLAELWTGSAPPEDKEIARRLYQRCMQLTGPLMAKGMEDTLMYCYHRFIAHNEVGDSPEAFGVSTAQFHAWMQARQQQMPLSMNATATHDSKRGEDVRMRLNALSVYATEWQSAVSAWHSVNEPLRTQQMPGNNDAYFIYQTLIGTYPMEGIADAAYTRRLQAYIEKALREGKQNSSWEAPNEAYEKATLSFVERILDPAHGFLEQLLSFRDKIRDAGIVNSLGQLLLKATCPGVPDFYQGTELWDLSMVDPDNRRAVDYALRSHMQDTLPQARLPQLWRERYNGALKMWLTQRLLALREAHPALFSQGTYMPCITGGKYAAHVLTFARRYQDTWLLVVVSLHSSPLPKSDPDDILTIDWADTFIQLPAEMTGVFTDLQGKSITPGDGTLPVAGLLQELPVSCLLLQQARRKRSAGVLLPLTALPGSWGIGDMGPGAYRFADKLAQAGQRYWQVLPLTPVAAACGNSPYNAPSGMAGNPLLISPELLVQEGFLEANETTAHMLPAASSVDYDAVRTVKNLLLEKAYGRFLQPAHKASPHAFELFCVREAYWLKDFARFSILKERFEGRHWSAWPESFKKRDTAALEALDQDAAAQLQQVKWLQFLFFRQWQQLKSYCNALDIRLIGDLPFYVSHDAADVWANQQLFRLDADGAILKVAGVPPDYFSKTGQLWGMPTYDWEALKENKYQWWVERLRHHAEHFDLVRIDHFRALASYWEVGAGETTAENGVWRQGPGMDFFHAVKEKLGSLPFIAEDLGDNMEDAYKLREVSGLAGMKVIQFAFGENMPDAVDAPHHYPAHCIAYTGTHDNNTLLGWFRLETSPADRERMRQYLGFPVTESNVHEAMIRLLYASVAATVILPVQDMLGLDQHARFNTPGQAHDNWTWRMTPEQFHQLNAAKFLDISRRYGRA